MTTDGPNTSQSMPGISNQVITDIAGRFVEPPAEYCAAIWWGWTGPMTRDVIRHDLDALQKLNARSFLIEAGYDMTDPYLSPGWFELVAFAVAEAKRRGMCVWIEDEGKYPSGFAGGKFTQLRPDLGMQALVVAQTSPASPGQAVSFALSPAAVGVIAVNLDDQSSIVLESSGNTIHFTAPPGRWEVRIIEHQLKTSQTRCVNNPTKAKDESNTLCDYMNPAAVAQFIEWTHEQYKQAIGDEFGKTFLGFMSDEPDFLRMPWTPSLVDEFHRRKGYDLRPWLAHFFAPQMNEQAKRVKADFWDVWSAIFADSFFGQIGRWCHEHGVQYIAHLNCEDKMPSLVKSEGDFFRCMRDVHVPGIDTIWDQIWPGKVNDFPKLASSAAHLYGRARAFSESFAAYKPIPNVRQCRWIMNHQMVRGINLFLVMYYACSVSTNEQHYAFFDDPGFPALLAYINRACYLLSQGWPAARIALYLPTTSMWLGDDASNQSVLSIAQSLLESQRDFDFVGDDAIAIDLQLLGGQFINASGQAYDVVMVPSVTTMSARALARLRQFQQTGGRVIFMGHTPLVVPDLTFAAASGPAELNWAICEPSDRLTSRVIDALGPADVKLDRPCPHLKCLRRNLKDAVLYFFFNEFDSPLAVLAELSGVGQVEIWNASSGAIRPTKVRSSEGRVKVDLQLGPEESTFLVIRGQ